MRISAEERPLPPWPTCPLSMTTILPAFRFARWNAIEAPITPAPRITMSAVMTLEAGIGVGSGGSGIPDESSSGLEALGRLANGQLPVLRARFSALGFGLMSFLGGIFLQSPFFPVAQDLVGCVVSGGAGDAASGMC